MKFEKTWMIGAGLIVALAGCGDDGGNDDGSNNDSSTGQQQDSGDQQTDTGATDTGDTPTTTVDDTAGETEEPPMECNGTGEGTAAEGDACTANSDCASGVCTLFTDVPVNEDAVCAATPANCGTRVTGTIFDFSTGAPVGGANLVVAAALQAATNPTGAMALVEATSGDDGRVDGTSDAAISAPLGIVGLASADGYYLTATGVSSPGEDMQSYDVGTGIHDLWMVPTGELTAWSDMLAMDAEVPAEALPLGDAGGVVGFVRDASGAPIAGVEVASTSDTSGAIVRYLNDDGTMGTDVTSATGVFFILEPGVPESFEASLDGTVLGGGTAGSANGAVFTLIVNAP